MADSDPTVDLHHQVAAFIDPVKIRLFRDDVVKGEWQTLPSLLLQLQAATKHGGGAGSAQFGSRPVISTQIVAMMIDITHTTSVAVVKLTGSSRGNVADNLRAVAATVTGDQVPLWSERVRRWVSEARSRLQLDPQRPRAVRGVCCPACGARDVRLQQDGENMRVPALVITWVGPDDEAYHPDVDWTVRAVECRACHQCWWRGGAMDSLIGQMLEANRTRETLAEP